MLVRGCVARAAKSVPVCVSNAYSVMPNARHSTRSNGSVALPKSPMTAARSFARRLGFLPGRQIGEVLRELVGARQLSGQERHAGLRREAEAGGPGANRRGVR